MESKRLLIVGIDPGMTTAYAALDIEGKFVASGSSKQLDLKSMISETIKLGKVLLVGTDKAKVPGLAEAFAAKIGARIISPGEDLKVEEKRKITREFKLGDEHQADALAAAIFAYKETKTLLDKIDFFIKENGKQEIGSRLKELVMTKRISISNAAKIIEAKEEDEQVIENVISERKLTESDFLKLYNKLKRYESEIKIMRSYNSNLRNRLERLGKGRGGKEPGDGKKADKFRQERLVFFENLLKSKNREICDLMSMMRGLLSIISDMSSFIVLKKLDSLSANEFSFKNKVLNIQRNDILLVDNPGISSPRVIEALKDKVFVIVHRNPLAGKTGEMPFVFVNAKNLKIQEYGHFAFAEKKNFEAEKSRVNWVRKIIDDYRREKELCR
ncbi:DUF460 domain-containing protein [Candidatus Woesearchaeota archaeon]|nr:DUF460 domain-containing protein [Candidatus Woesearchaeota archaeon]